MKSGGGPRKGAAFERKVCKDLSRFIVPKSDEVLFWRSAMSGGRATVMAKKGELASNQAGDLTCIHEKGMWLTEHFTIECKFYKSLDVQSSLIAGKGKLVKFWKQACRDAEKHDKHPMLIAKGNRCRTLLLLDYKGLQSFIAFGRKLPPPLVVGYRIDPQKKPVWVYDYSKTFRLKHKIKRAERSK